MTLAALSLCASADPHSYSNQTCSTGKTARCLGSLCCTLVLQASDILPPFLLSMCGLNENVGPLLSHGYYLTA
jgi:hypothetical protein